MKLFGHQEIKHIGAILSLGTHLTPDMLDSVINLAVRKTNTAQKSYSFKKYFKEHMRLELMTALRLHVNVDALDVNLFDDKTKKKQLKYSLAFLTVIDELLIDVMEHYTNFLDNCAYAKNLFDNLESLSTCEKDEWGTPTWRVGNSVARLHDQKGNAVFIFDNEECKYTLSRVYFNGRYEFDHVNLLVADLNLATNVNEAKEMLGLLAHTVAYLK